MAFNDLQALVALPGDDYQRLQALENVWVVGGWLRDGWLKLQPRDIDLVVKGEFTEVLENLAQLYECTPFELGQRHGSHRLVSGDLTIDLSPLYGQGIESDLARRDYTVNTLALPAVRLGTEISAADMEMYPGADSDLDQRVLRFVSDQNLAEDPLRVLRGYRLCAEFEFEPEAETRKSWGAIAGRISECAGERIHEELLRLLGVQGGISRYIEWMAADGVLWHLIPELQATAGCLQNEYHHTDVWTHTLEALRSLERLRADLPDELTGDTEILNQALADPVSGLASGLALVRLALLLHDIEKPGTSETQPDGRVTFHQHQELGSQTSHELLTRLKFSADETDLVCQLVLEHLRLGFYSDHDPLPARLTYRYIRKLGSATPLAVWHSLADCMATRGPLNEGGLTKHIRAARTILRHFTEQDVVAAPPALMDGNEIMELLGIPPGRIVGILKSAMMEATAAGDLATADEARTFVKALYQDTGRRSQR